MWDTISSYSSSFRVIKFYAFWVWYLSFNIVIKYSIAQRHDNQANLRNHTSKQQQAPGDADYIMSFTVHQWLFLGSALIATLILYLNIFVFNEQFLLEQDSNEFKFTTEHLGEIGGVKYIISDKHGVLSFSSFLDYMVVDDKRFRNLLIQILRKFPAESYFWECKSVSLTTLDSTAFEFVIIPSSELVGINGSSAAFQDKFSSCGTSKVTTFPNTGNHSNSWPCLCFL